MNEKIGTEINLHSGLSQMLMHETQIKMNFIRNSTLSR